MEWLHLRLLHHHPPHSYPHPHLLPVYRLQFNETFAEMNRPSNEWKTVIGCVFFFCGITALIIWWQRVYGELQHLTWLLPWAMRCGHGH